MNIDQNESAACTGIEEDFSSLSLVNLPQCSQNITSALQKIYSNIHEEEFAGVQQIRKELSKELNPPIDEVINTSIVPVLIRMAYQRNEKFAFEVSWILCNIASGNSTHTKYLVDHNCLEFFNKVFDSNPNSWELKDQIIWAIGNISGDSVKFRDLINNSLFFNKALQYGRAVLESKSDKFKGNLIWTLSNFTRGKPPPSQEFLVKLDAFFTSSLTMLIDKPEILADTLWGMAYSSESIKDLANYNDTIMSLIIRCLLSNTFKLQIPALRIIGNFISNVNNSWNRLKNFNILQILNSFLEHSKPSIRKEAVWIFSNFAAESEEVVVQMMNLRIFHTLFAGLPNQDEKVVNEIVWTVSNSFLNASPVVAQQLVEIGWIEKFLEIFESGKENKVMIVILEGITYAAQKCPNALDSAFKNKFLNLLEVHRGNGQIKKKIQTILKILNDLVENHDLEMEDAC